MRKKIIIGNWKMNLNLIEARDLVFRLKSNLISDNEVDTIICPPFIHLLTICNILKGSNIHVGAQNMFYKEQGAFTGEISPKMLTDLHISHVIIGHSERRQTFHETDNDVNLKIKAAFEHDLTPVFCVGEDLNTREKGKAEDWVKNQVLEGLKGLNLNSNGLEKIIIAYEPIWAIGTGKICKGDDANKIIKMIRNIVKDISSKEISEKVRILYGGSIKPDNFTEHIKFSDIDGGLVGGASLSFDDFYQIINLTKDSTLKVKSR